MEGKRQKDGGEEEISTLWRRTKTTGFYSEILLSNEVIIITDGILCKNKNIYKHLKLR